MRFSRPAALVAMAAIPVLSLACGEDSSLFGQPAPGTGGTGGSTSSSGSGGSTSSSGIGGAGGSTQMGGAGGTGGTSCTPVDHDEDGDTVDDGCDNCPSYGNFAQDNGDQDEVGDLCEAPGDPALWQTIESFEPFVVPPGAGWNLDGYAHGPDELEVDTPFNAGRNANWLTPQAGTYSVETSFAYDGNSTGYAGVRFGDKGAAWWACLVNRSWALNGFRYDIAIWEYPGTGTQVLLRAQTDNVGGEPAGLHRRVRVHVRPGGDVLCTYEDEDNHYGEVQYGGGNVDGGVGLRAYDTHLHFFNFVVYK
jgi:hypothetical protein